MDGDRPCKTKWYLGDRCFYFSILFDWPVHRLSDDILTIEKLDDWHSFEYSSDMTDRPIRISSFEIILHKHDSGSFFEDKSLWCKTSFFERFDEFFWSFRSRLIDHRIIMDLIESVCIVFIDWHIPSKELRMIIGLDRNISWCEKILWSKRHFSWADLIQDCKKWVWRRVVFRHCEKIFLVIWKIDVAIHVSIFWIASYLAMTSNWSVTILLPILCRQCANSKRKSPPRTMLECKLRETWSLRNGWKLEKISDKDDLYSAKWLWRYSWSLKKKIKWGKEFSWEHRYLIDNQDRNLCKSLHEIFTREDIFEIFTRKRLSYSHPTPWMDRHPADMSRSYSGRSGNSHSYSMLVTMSNKSVHEKCLSTPRSSCQKYIVSHREYVKSLILNHVTSVWKKKWKTIKKSHSFLSEILWEYKLRSFCYFLDGPLRIYNYSFTFTTIFEWISYNWSIFMVSFTTTNE